MSEQQNLSLQDSEELSAWLDAIADDIKAGRCSDGILQHLLKHVGEPVGIGEPCEDMRDWMASLLNLVEIAQRVYGIKPTAREQLRRLQVKFDKEGVENGYTPNPKERMPELASRRSDEHSSNAFCDLPESANTAYTPEQAAQIREKIAKTASENLKKIRVPDYVRQLSPDRQAAWRDGQRAAIDALRNADVSDIIPGVIKHFAQVCEETKKTNETAADNAYASYAATESTKQIVEITSKQLASKLGKPYLEVATVFEQFRIGRIADLPEAYKVAMSAMCDGKEGDFCVRVAMPTYSSAELTADEIRFVNEMCHSGDFVPYPAVGTPAVFETGAGLVPCTTLGIDPEKPHKIWIRLSANKGPWKAGEVFHWSQTRVIPRDCVLREKSFARFKTYEYTQDKYVPTTDA